MELAANILASLTPSPLTIFTFAAMTALELFLGREQHSLASRLPGLIYWLLLGALTVLVYQGFRLILAWIGIKPLIVLPLDMAWSGALAVVLAPIAGAVVTDFFFYWCHRAQHRWFWRYHAVHHSIRELNSVNSYHHVTEPLLQAMLMILPSALILPDIGPVVPIAAFLVHMQSSYIHSNTRLHFGPLRALLVDNRFHRIHHSVEERHFDKNFGATTTLWDRLFGTAHFPAPHEWPETGIAEADQPRTIGQWLTLPYRYPSSQPAEAKQPAAPPAAAPQVNSC